MARRRRFARPAGTARAKLLGRPPVELHCTESAPKRPSGWKPEPGPLLPGSPFALGLCRYGPLPSKKLEASKLLTRHDQIRRVVTGLNALPTMPDGVYSTPMDDGSVIIVQAFYRRSPPLVVHVGLSGGLMITRVGVAVRWDARSRGAFVLALQHLTQ